MIVTLGLATLGYQTTLRLNVLRGVTVWNPSTRFDEMIPAVGWTIFPYLGIYAYGPFVVLLAPRTDRARCELLLICQAMLIITLISSVVFVVLPCEVHLVKQVPESILNQEGIGGILFRVMRAVDRPYNAYPSLHISLTLCLVLAASSVNWWSRSTNLAWWLVWISVVISVHTTKQHYIFDMLTGSVLAWAVWRYYLRGALDALESPA
jgi:membrane-associated phospholipid phosphatase